MAKTYACPFCNEKYHRDKLAKHIEKHHDDEVPHDLTPYRVAYDVINDHPDHRGKCSICGAKTNWNEKTMKYHRLCGRKECYEAVKKTYQNRMLKVYNYFYLYLNRFSTIDFVMIRKIVDISMNPRSILITNPKHHICTKPVIQFS